MEGWIHLHRKLLTWEWFQDSHMVHLFLYLLLRASYEQKSWQGITIERGQLIAGYPSIKRDTGISVRSVRTCISRLKSTGEIAVKSTNRYSIITICNYDKYNDFILSVNSPNDRQPDSQATGKRQANDNIQEYKEYKNIKNNNRDVKIFVKPTIEEVKQYCTERGGKVNAEQWFNFYESKGWMIGKNKMKDWKAAVRTWENNGTKTEPSIKPEEARINYSWNKRL